MKADRITLPLLFVVLSPLVLIGIRYLTRSLHNFPLNSLRMGAGSVTLGLIVAIWFRAELIAAMRSWRTVALLTVFGASGAVCLFATVEGLARTSAAMGGLIAILGMPLTLVLAAAFYSDERQIASDRRFVIGIAVAIVGTVGFVLTAPGARITYSIGAAWFLLTMSVDALRCLLLKHLLAKVHPLPVGTVTVVIPFAVFSFLTAATGRGDDITGASPQLIAITLASGAGGVLVGSALYLVLVQRIGITRVKVLYLITPVLAAGFGYVLLGDKLSVLQMLCGLVVIAGCQLCFRRMFRSTRRSRNRGASRQDRR